MTALEVLDSAIKIGLGALIAGVSAFFIGRAQHQRDLEKERVNREFELLKQVAEHVEIVTHVALKYWALIVEFGRYKRNGSTMPAHKDAAIDACVSELFVAFKEMTQAEAKLLLLGYKPAQAKARIYGELVTTFRRQVHRDNPPMTDAQDQEWRTKLLAARESLFDELSSCYRKLGP